ncbi:MAG: purine-nucleoside phosphorylase [Clostridia bacterium]|nr:purine-nucleoside phosphorylase [Clostridia bacterium]
MSQSNCPTPHIDATPVDFAKTVLMPGDPLRAKFIAETYLENARLVNPVRGINGYTGTWKGVPVSVMASGMGIPSIGIYSYELFNFFDIDHIIRIGSAGSIQPNVHTKELVLGMGASTNSDYAAQYGLNASYSAIADYRLLRMAADICEERRITHHVGNIISTDIYYHDDLDINLKWQKMGILAVEMEAAGLYMNAARAGKHALAICSVSNNILTGEELPVETRETGFTDMMEVALELAYRLGKEEK